MVRAAASSWPLEVLSCAIAGVKSNELTNRRMQMRGTRIVALPFSLVIGGRAAGDAENFLVPIEECSSSDSLRCVFLSSRHNKPLHLCLYDMAGNPLRTLFRAQIAADIRCCHLLLHCRQHSLINPRGFSSESKMVQHHGPRGNSANWVGDVLSRKGRR